jgi:hypothetical protein
MLLAARHLVDRKRQPRTRADELLRLRERLVAQRAPEDATDEELALARDLARLRVELTSELEARQPRSCSGCARGRSLPHGRWNGGHCCGAPTFDLFTDDELASLRLAGTTPARLAPPPPGTDHAGCAFRGPDGCSLAPVDRPNLCVRFLCRELEAELARSDVSNQRLKSLARELSAAFRRFEDAHERSFSGRRAVGRAIGADHRRTPPSGPTPP